MNKKHILLISGATATGKSSFAINIAQQVGGEIINADIGSFYKPMTIGTAKPDWARESVPHHMFDVLDKPESLTVVEFRKQVQELCQQIWERGKVPLIVGGSAFYIRALLYKQQDIVGTEQYVAKLESQVDVSSQEMWDELSEIDVKRAQDIDPQDRYRIVRALAIFKATGKKPSEFCQVYAPIAPYHFIICQRDRVELYNRIDVRVLQMIEEGWLDEVKCMMGTPWEKFLQHKKMIGYDDLLQFLAEQEQNLDKIVARIQKRTRNYAKRQVTFLKKLERQVRDEILKAHSKDTVESVDLTLCDVGLYINQLLLKLSKRFG